MYGYRHQVLCPHCDLVVELPLLGHGEKALCPRCSTKLHQYNKHDNYYAAGYAISALILFVIACAYFFLRIDVFEFYSSISLPEILTDMILLRNYPLAFFFGAFILFLPVFLLSSTIVLCFRLPLPKRIAAALLYWSCKLRQWSMPEIFMAGVLVSFVKITSYGHISLSISFIAYCGFIIMSIASQSRQDMCSLWRWYLGDTPLPKVLVNGLTGKAQGVRLCPTCEVIVDEEQPVCPRCHQTGHVRKPLSIQATIALLLCSVILYLPANIYPVMITELLGTVMSSTILQGAMYMWETGAYFVGIIIFMASVMIPSVKIIGLLWLSWFSKRRSVPEEADCYRMGKLYKVILFVGRWSMIDVFVVIVTTSLIRIAGIMNAYPEKGIIFFASVVIVTMFAADAFDPRIMWDRLSESPAVEPEEELGLPEASV